MSLFRRAFFRRNAYFDRVTETIQDGEQAIRREARQATAQKVRYFRLIESDNGFL